MDRFNTDVDPVSINLKIAKAPFWRIPPLNCLHAIGVVRCLAADCWSSVKTPIYRGGRRPTWTFNAIQSAKGVSTASGALSISIRARRRNLQINEKHFGSSLTAVGTLHVCPANSLFWEGIMSLTRKSAYGLCAILVASTGSLICSIAAAQAPNCPTGPAIDQNRSLVVTDAALDKAKFSFVNTIDAILRSLQIQATAENRENFVKSLLTSMNDDDMVNPVSGLRMKVDIRALEAGLSPKSLLDPLDPIGLVPIALFNRLDLAPQDWSNCGEHRIVYGFKAPVPKGGPASRFFLIFEARVDNALPQKVGFEGCRAVVNFWRDLSDENDASKRAIRLEDFYYKGAAGVSGPVVQAKNYGGPLGQVRGNLFVNSPNFFRMAIARMDRDQLWSTNASQFHSSHS